MRRMALVAYFVSVVISSACASSDEFGWWRVKDVPVPDVEFQDDSPPLRALPVPDGTVNMDLGLALGLPATTFEHIAELARGLDYNPDNCYRYVRNNIAYASYYGLLRGPERTLVDREGNELDQAFLLLALLRASGYSLAGIGYSPLAYTNEVLASHFRIPLRKQESGIDYNAADWLGVDATGSVSDVAGRVSVLLALAGHQCRVITESGVPYLATDHFYTTLSAAGGTYLMDPSLKPSARRLPCDAAADSGYSRDALLSAVGGSMSNYYVQNLSKVNLAAFLDGLQASLRNAWTNENVATGCFVGESAIVSQPMDDSLYFHGTKFGGRKDFLGQPDGVKNYYRARATLKIGTTTLAAFYLDELALRNLWISFEESSSSYPRAVLHLDSTVLASEPNGSSAAIAPLQISISYLMGSNAHTYFLKRGVANVYAVPVGFGGDVPSGMRKIASEELAERMSPVDCSSHERLARSLFVAGQQWISQVSMCLRMRSRFCGYTTYDYYNVGISGYDGAPYIDFGNRFGYFSNLTSEMEGEAFFSSALEHSVQDQLNGTERPSVSTVRLIDAANSAGVRIYFATSNNYSVAISNLTGYDYAVKTNIQQRVRGGCSALIPKSGSIVVNGWTGYGYAMQDHVNCVSGMFISGGMNGGYCTVNAVPSGLEYVERTSSVMAPDGSIVQPVSADPVVMPDGAFVDAVTDLSLEGGSSLQWTRHYDSRQKCHSGDLGFGWFHCFEASVAEVADPDSFFGAGSVDSVLPTVVANFVVDDMLKGEWGMCNSGGMARRWTIAAMVAQWWTERTTSASVAVRLGARSLRFFRRSDGSYAGSPGVTASLELTSEGTYVLTERHGNVYAFNADGRLATITDQSGNATTFSYSSNRLVRVENAFGASFSLTWSGDFISRVTDSAGRYVVYSYDSAGRLSQVDDVRGKRTSLGYDQSTSALSTKVDPVGNMIVRNYYSLLGQVTNQVSDAGGVWTFGYCRGDSSWDEAPDGGRRTQSFDSCGRVSRDKSRGGGWTCFGYDGHGHLICSTNSFGRIETCAYGAKDLLLASDVNAEGHRTGFAYDEHLRIVAATNAVGGVTRFMYDDKHRVVKKIMPDFSSISNEWTQTGLLSAQTVLASDETVVRKTVWEYATSGVPASKTVFGLGLPQTGVKESYGYDSARRMTSMMDANGNLTVFTYDNAGNLLTKRAPDGALSTFVYDDAGRRVSSTDALGRTTTFSWTPSGRLSSTTWPDGGVAANVYDANDRLVQSTDVRGTTATFDYDMEGRCVRSVDPAGTSYCSYNAAGLLCSETNAVGGVTVMGYDFAYNPTVISNCSGRARWMAYDGLGRVVACTNSIGRTRRFSYDGQSRKTSVIRPSGAADLFGYDTLGNITACTNAEGHVYQMAYDALGHMISATNAIGERVFAGGYDGVGNMTTCTDGSGRTAAFAYDPCGRLVLRTTADGADSLAYDLAGNMTSASNSVAAETFAYDALDQLTNAVTRIGVNHFSVSWQRDFGGLATNVVYAPGKSVVRAYDEAGRLASVKDWLGHTWTFSWNGLGQQTGGTSPDGTVHAFSYDVCGNLVAWSVNGIAGRTIQRDTEGRRLRDTVTVGPMPVATLRRNAQNTFDAADRLVSATVAYNGATMPVTETFLYDGNGAMTNATSAGETVFAAAYDAQGRIVSLGEPSSSPTSFSYDAHGNRVCIGERIFIPDHSDPLKRPLIECDAGGTPLRYYIWGPGRLLGFIAVGTLTVAHSDEHGSVIALTDTDGELLYRANYSPHGEDWGSSGDNPTPFAWLGGLGVVRQLSAFNSQLSTLYLTRHRLYSPVLQRFLSADPLSIDGGLNLYAYANGDPLAYVDPLGLCASPDSLPGLLEMLGSGLSATVGYGARIADGVWNFALEFSVSNPNFREADVQNAVYQAMVDEWGSPLRRLSAYGESQMVADPEIVNAVWDLGAAVTAYRNLGGKPGTPIGKLETGKITPDRFKRIPNNLPEELTLDEATHGAGNRIMENKVLGDPRYSGMEKWQHVHVNPDGTKIVIHFVVDPRTGERTDFKFK